MRSSISTTAVRDASRVCARCCLQARQASSMAALNHPAQRFATRIRGATELQQQQQQSKSSPSHLAKASFSSTTHVRTAATPSSTSTKPQTLYDIFPNTLPSGPPPSGRFPIDVRALRREFLQLQARAHPDMHPSGPPKARAEARSALINEAYKTLSNPLLRAQYLLSLRGVDVANDETLKIEDPNLLMVVLEAHEEISDAASEEDLQNLKEVNDERIRQSEEVLERAFREDDVKAAKVEAVRMRYWVNIKQSLDDWEEGKEPVLQH